MAALKRTIRHIILIAGFAIALHHAGCKSHSSYISSLAYYNDTINTHDSGMAMDTALWRMILPYKQALDAQMNEVIAVADTDLYNKRPEGNLGNFVADVLRDDASKMLQRDVDMAITNVPGMRLPVLPKGNITVGKVYELLPFENMMLVAEIEGATLKKVIENVAARGGEAISGFRMEISKDGKLLGAYYKDAQLDFSRKYTLCTTDFLFNGGDGYTMFAEAVQVWPLKISIRDMVMAHIRKMGASNVSIKAVSDGRTVVK